MQTPEQPVPKNIVLVGGGHSHVGVLRRFGMQPLPGVRLTLICRDALTPYSGMLPGYVAGHYSYDEVHIDLARLADFAGARFICDEALGLDRSARKVLCRSHAPLNYDFASINIGSAPRMDQAAGAREHAVPVKPIPGFDSRWQALIERARMQDGALRIAVVGAGAGGVEMTLAMQHRLRIERSAAGHDPDDLHFDLLTSDATILPTHNARVRRAFERVLARRRVAVHIHAEVCRVSAGCLHTAAGASVKADAIFWATRAGGPTWLRDTGLALDADGFLRVGETLQSVGDPRIFAAGDVASMEAHPREKAGVFAVRQGRPLADNLRRALAGATPQPYRPQRTWLALISTGERYAVASRGWLYFEGRWVWHWKDWIDRRFMRKYSKLPSAVGRA